MEEFKVPTLPSTSVNGDETTKPAESAPQQSKEPPMVQQQCPYKMPPWSDKPVDLDYKFEVLKSGIIIDEVKALQEKANWKFGRLQENDIEMKHPTVSRFHAVLQYKPENAAIEEDPEKKTPACGWYIYDLDSTHGTFLNKQRIPPRVFIRMRVGHMLRLGASTRCYILQGPVEDEEPESELSVTELKAERQRLAAEAIVEAKRKAEEAEAFERREGISWGMGDDADEETDLTHNPYASTNNEELFLDDPKRTLRGYFEREDVPLEYKCDEMSAGSFVCRIELPLDDAYGRPIIAEVVHKGRKKECVVQCALEACRILDRHGVLRQANQEPLKRKVKSQDVDSDEDEFWDRTGDVERKKMRKSQATTSVTLTYNDLLKQEGEVLEQLEQVESEIAKYQEIQKRVKAQQTQQGEDLDSFMENLTEDLGQLDKTEIRKLRLEQQRLKMEQQKLQRLIAIAKPLDLISGTKVDSSTKNSKEGTSKKTLPMIGKRNQFSKFKIVKVPTTTTQPKSVLKAFASDGEEVDEDEMDEQQTKKSEECVTNKDSASIETEGTHLKHKGPVVIPAESNDDDITETLGQKSTVEPAAHNDQTDKTDVSKKRRPRQRQRLKRQEDMDELNEHESCEKYAKWIPPENQSGDGYTELNKKYGY